ncbi:hypothetical protein BH11PSE11_BH11PSE11_07440 [soil metagenome]
MQRDPNIAAKRNSLLRCIAWFESGRVERRCNLPNPAFQAARFASRNRPRDDAVRRRSNPVARNQVEQGVKIVEFGGHVRLGAWRVVRCCWKHFSLAAMRCNLSFGAWPSGENGLRQLHAGDVRKCARITGVPLESGPGKFQVMYRYFLICIDTFKFRKRKPPV